MICIVYFYIIIIIIIIIIITRVTSYKLSLFFYDPY